MMTNGKIAVAVVGGYLLGRTKKAKLAVGLGMLLAGKKIALDPQQLKKSLAEAPLLSGLNSEVRKELADATRQAATKAVSDRVSGLADSLHERTALLRGEGGGGDEGENEGQGAEAEDERDRGEGEEPAEEPAEGRPEGEAEPEPKRKPKPPRPPRKAAAKAPARPAKKTAASGSGTAKKAAAKKTTAKKTTAKKAAAKKTDRTAGGRNG
ncbi:MULTISPECIES: hypothetical protein [unclassified Streptomyces]|uniref:hypothetical protein n=1 Tax=unclassified Streptomyces TaxID=2593676 RepID=UPI00168B4A6C|nr:MULTISPECIES: hypothetical protein [unclassified Streptomyces]MBD3009212.1 hypothetical protein [Streptomyces sp. 5-10]